jgi:hypothetical protein
MKEIKLWRTSREWMTAMYVDGAPDPEVVELFGTHEIPTAFTAKADLDTVVAVICKLNPGVAVTVEAR